MAFAVARCEVKGLPTTVHQLLLEDERRTGQIANSPVVPSDDLCFATEGRVAVAGPSSPLAPHDWRLQHLMSSICRDVRKQHVAADEGTRMAREMDGLYDEIAALEEQQRQEEAIRADEWAMQTALRGSKGLLQLRKAELADALEHERCRIEEERTLLVNVRAREWEKLQVPPIEGTWGASHPQRVAAGEMPILLTRRLGGGVPATGRGDNTPSGTWPRQALSKDSGSRDQRPTSHNSASVASASSRPPSAIAPLGLVAPDGSEGPLGRVVRVGQLVGLTRSNSRPNSSADDKRTDGRLGSRSDRFRYKPTTRSLSPIASLLSRPPSSFLPPRQQGYTEPDEVPTCAPVKELLTEAVGSRQQEIGLDVVAIRLGTASSVARATMREVQRDAGNETAPDDTVAATMLPRIGSHSNTNNAVSSDVLAMRLELELLEREQQAVEDAAAAREAERRRKVFGW